MARSPYVALHVNVAGRRVVAADLVDAVVREHAAGRLPAGSRLPPVRVLEQQLGLSKNTAQVAYDELVARGVAITRERDGVFIADATGGGRGPARRCWPRRCPGCARRRCWARARRATAWR
jgi:DNA-binding transcriptional MocR family regulator